MAKPEARHNLTPGRNCGETGIARSPGTYLLCSAASGTASLHPQRGGGAFTWSGSTRRFRERSENLSGTRPASCWFP